MTFCRLLNYGLHLFLGSSDQVRYLVSHGCIPPMCDLLTVMDAKIVQVALSGLENILRFGQNLLVLAHQISEYFPNPTMPIEQFWCPLMLEERI